MYLASFCGSTELPYFAQGPRGGQRGGLSGRARENYNECFGERGLFFVFREFVFFRELQFSLPTRHTHLPPHMPLPGYNIGSISCALRPRRPSRSRRHHPRHVHVLAVLPLPYRFNPWLSKFSALAGGHVHIATRQLARDKHIFLQPAAASLW